VKAWGNPLGKILRRQVENPVVEWWQMGAGGTANAPWASEWDKFKKHPVRKQCTAPYVFLTKSSPRKG
jgi:hypothetical protein